MIRGTQMTELSILCGERKHMVGWRNVLQLVRGFAFWCQNTNPNSEKVFGEKIFLQTLSRLYVMVQIKCEWHFGRLFFFYVCVRACVCVYKIGVGLCVLDHSTFYFFNNFWSHCSYSLAICSSFDWKLAKGMVGKPVFWKSGHLAALGPLQY